MVDGINSNFNSAFNVKLSNRGAKQTGLTFEMKSIFLQLEKSGQIKDTKGDGFTAKDAQNLFATLNKLHQSTGRSTDYNKMGVGTEYQYTADEMKELAKAAGYEVIENKGADGARTDAAGAKSHVETAAPKEGAGQEETTVKTDGARAEQLVDAATTSSEGVVQEQKPTHTLDAMKDLKSPVKLSGALTEKEVTDELFTKWSKQGGGKLPALAGEVNEGDWSTMLGGEKRKEMLCRDDSGKTQDIRGDFRVLSDTFEKNPDAFTITDNSSGNDHAYLYRKIGVNDGGQPVYKCISMNGNKISTDNQYTLEWTKDGYPELVQHNGQDNHGIGLRVGNGSDRKEATAKTVGKKVVPGKTTGKKISTPNPTSGNGRVKTDGPYRTEAPGRASGKGRTTIEDPYTIVLKHKGWTYDQ